MRTIDRWVPWVLSAALAVLAVAAVIDGRPGRAAVCAALAALAVWQARRAARPRPPVPAHVDEQWARAVLTAAGDPQGVPAVKALRDAEPALSLLEAKELADRAQA
jgi:ribosomal protein L7/L12